MYEELDPLGLQSAPHGDQASTLGDLVAKHPLVAIAASAAVGAAVVALVALATRRSDARDPWQGLGSQASEKYADLQAQVGKLLERFNDSLPGKKDISRAASDLGGGASKLKDALVGGVKQSFQEAATAGGKVTEAAAAHPLLTSLVLGALGTVLASIATAPDVSTSGAASSEKQQADGAPL